MDQPRPAPEAAPVPQWLRGLWRRQSIVHADGRRDDTTLVYWLQGASAFADLRIPADRPDLTRCAGLAGLDHAAQAQLARQAGFAGWTELDGDRCRWHRTLDFQPPTGVPDEGRLRRESDDLLIEEGVHEPYVERWERIASGPEPSPVRGLGPLDPGVVLVTCGDVFIYACERRPPLPRADSLAALLDAAPGDRSARAALLDCEISFGLCRGGRLPWEVQLSTHPFRQGRSLEPAAGAAA